MASAHPHTRIIQKATPVITIATGHVKSWQFDVVFQSDENGWFRVYPFKFDDLEWMEKTPEQFTKADLLGMISPSYDHIFDAHFDSMHPGPSVEEAIGNFDLNLLGTQPVANTP